MTAPLLAVADLVARLGPAPDAPRIVDGVSFEVREGEMFGIVGESGSGKSVTLRALLRLARHPIELAGSVRWRGRELLTLPSAAMRAVRGGEIGMVFQEPMAALNPVLTVGRQIAENLAAHGGLTGRAGRRRAVELLDLVGIPSPRHRLHDYPHQFSGGMRQRAMLAIALAASPHLLLADEPTTALDVTIQDQVLRLLLRLREELGMSVVLVTHDLGVVAQTCDRVAVMYAGRIVESGPVAQVLTRPRHAYTLGLLRSVPGAGARRSRLAPIGGMPPPLGERPDACAFVPRCPFATGVCAAGVPPFLPVAPGQASACRHARELPELREAA